MLDTKIVAVCSEIHENQRNTLHGQNIEFMNVKSRGTSLSSDWTLAS
jgi:hypothetical protein